MCRPSSAGVSRVGWSAELVELAEKEADWRARCDRGDTGDTGADTPLNTLSLSRATEHPFPGGTMDEQALYTTIAPELEHTDEEHARDIIRIIRAVLLARDREIARELRLHPERHH